MKKDLSAMLRLFVAQVSEMDRGIEANPIISVRSNGGLIEVDIDSTAEPCSMKFNAEVFNWPVGNFRGRLSDIAA